MIGIHRDRLALWAVWAALAATTACTDAEPTQATALLDATADLPKPKFDTGLYDTSQAKTDANPGVDGSTAGGSDAEEPQPDTPVQDGDFAGTDAQALEDGGNADDLAPPDGADASTADSPAADTASCSSDGACDDSDPCTKDLCIDGQCSHPGNGSCCTTQAQCQDNNACTADQCTSSGCVHTLTSCDDGLPCTADGCDKVTGACKHLIKAGTCAIAGSCFAAGETDPANPCHRCDPAGSNSSWTDNDGAACDDGNACTGKDECAAGGTCAGTAKPGCCKANSDCATSDPCIQATCAVATGTCEAKPVSGCCSAGPCCDTATNKVSPAQTPCGAAIQSEWACNGKQAQLRKGAPACSGAGPEDCSSAAASLAWTAWQTTQTCTDQQKCVVTAGGSATCEPLVAAGCTTAAECSDGKACTDDGCVQGSCVHLPKKCPSGLACQMPTCDDATGQCGLKPQPGLCTIDGLCMTDGVKKPGDPCMACQTAVDPLNWTLTAACKCSSGSCCDAGKVKPTGTTCGTTAISTEYSCASDGGSVRKRIAVAGCSGPGGQCSTSAPLLVWQAWQTHLQCGGGTVCQVTNSANAGTCQAGADPACGQPDPQEAGVSLKAPFDVGSYGDASLPKSLSFQLGSASDVDVVRWQLTDAVNAKQPLVGASWTGSQSVEVCAFYACSQGSNGKDCAPLACPTGSTAKTAADVSGAAINGCCQSGASGSLAVAPKAVAGANASGQGWLQVTNLAGKCHALAVQLSFGQALLSPCVPGTTCCEDSGQFSAAGKTCGTVTLATEYSCDSTALGGKLLQRVAVAGCSGTAASCPTSSSTYAWSPWSTLKTCASSEVCSVSAPTVPGSCKVSTQCVPGSTCCDSKGQFAASGTLCSSALATEYQCSANAIQVRKKFGNCSGSSGFCSSLSPTWTSWATALNCSAGETCTPAALTSALPSCVPKTADLCSANDSYEGLEATASSYKLGTVNDSDAALWLSPKVKLQSATDKDFFSMDITDATNLTDPKVYVAWTASASVKVCAYYRCTLGANGTDCAPVNCPAGTDTYTNTAVSKVAGNGCCKTASSGVLEYTPDASGLDESGTVFFNLTNDSPACQEVAVRLAFGGATQSQCNPDTTCCAGGGYWASAGSVCGGPLKSEYRCATVNGNTQLQKRTAQGSCSGGAATCGSTSLQWSTWALELPCVGPESCASALPSQPGACLQPKPGSCGGACGGKSLTGTCYCDALCTTTKDCCADYTAECSGSCANSCGVQSLTGACWCDQDCALSGDCCLDKAAMCK